MIPRLGDVGAADLQTQLLKHLLSNLGKPILVGQKIHDKTIYTPTLWLTGESYTQCTEWVAEQNFPLINGQNISTYTQPIGDLGQRMSTISHQLLNETEKRDGDRSESQVILIGSDIPEISNRTIRNAILALQKHDVVIGPARDGGYYLIGMSANAYGTCKDLIFSDIPWGTDRVRDITIDRLHMKQISVGTLTLLRDVDRPEDLDYATRILKLPSSTS